MANTAFGLRHTALGAADLLLVGKDPPQVRVSNIGSSGEDGVSSDCRIFQR